jgi:hypothetical protein
MGFFTNLWGNIKHHVSNAWNEIKQRGSTLLTGTHYVGPWNSLSPEYMASHPPTDKVDASALHHDLDYSRIAKAKTAGTISASEAQHLTRESDNRFLHNVKSNFHENPWAATLGYAGIKGKNILEDLGVLHSQEFVHAKKGGIVAHRFKIAGIHR